MEETEDWSCEESCPVRLLDEQAGKSSPGHWPKGIVTGYGQLGGGTRSYGGQGEKEDGGNVSRFFYCAKASSWERDAGLEEFPKSVAGAMRGNQSDEPSRTAGDGVTPVRQVRAANVHPTVKPLAINRYIARLLLPPKLAEPRRILVPFAGSGSEMIGAMLAGWDEVIGIEREEQYVRIAEARLKWWSEHPGALDEKPVPSDAKKRATKEGKRSSSLEEF